MKQNPTLFVSRSRRLIIDEVDTNGLSKKTKQSPNQLSVSYPDLEIMKQTDWINYLEQLMISPMANHSSEKTFQAAFAETSPQRHFNTNGFHFFVSSEHIAGNITIIHIHYKEKYFFLHDQWDVNVEQIRFKVELRISADLKLSSQGLVE
ncbi:hypothetical protein QN372_20195 [Undibacterium sp. RTI2.1]|uniref:hypothetical protein n=1 Tax=unclassified Undibacterium TaxID=2630295 RepID=UPI002B226330|nr:MULTISPECIES: hypothetical protein [unclassified Undibacterium]MEB0033070.1 hypothetical protein [Undibacterium sp. RTI2.1]MEB0118930.1 hypothetical protein [Undibacterium sp. RTI2.2]